MEEQELNKFTEFLGYIAEDSGMDLESLIDELGEEGLTEAYKIFKEEASNFNQSNKSEEDSEFSEENEVEFAAKGTKLKMIRDNIKCSCGKKITMKVGGKIITKCDCDKMQNGGEVSKPESFNYQMKHDKRKVKTNNYGKKLI